MSTCVYPPRSSGATESSSAPRNALASSDMIGVIERRHRADVLDDERKPRREHFLVAGRPTFRHLVARVGERICSGPRASRRHADRWTHREGRPRGRPEAVDPRAPASRAAQAPSKDRGDRARRGSAARGARRRLSGHRALHGHQLEGRGPVRHRAVSELRHPPRGGFQRGDAAAGRGIAERSADVVAQADRRHAGQRAPMPPRLTTHRRCASGPRGCE